MIEKIKNLKKLDKLEIIISSLLKIFRGLFNKPFFKECNGLIFIGKKLSISFKRYISCGKNLKIEQFAEIQGLAKLGIRFGDNVTIGANVMIRPSSYYGGNIGDGLIVGNNSSIGPMSYIGCAGKVVIR